MKLEQVIDKILEYVEPDGEITADSSLKFDCGLTSFDTTCVVGELCEAFDVNESDIDMRRIHTVGELYAALTAAREAVTE